MNQSKEDYIFRLLSYIENFDFNKLDFLIQSLIQAEHKKKSVFIIGNGGSASTASHMATDLTSLNRNFNFSLKVQSLTDNSALLTAIGNDLSFEDIFSTQLAVLGSRDDLLIVISASGNSKNLILAVETAHKKGMNVFALVGFDGGKIKKLLPTSIHIETKNNDYGPVEDLHLIINHIVKERIRENLKSRSKELTRNE